MKLQTLKTVTVATLLIAGMANAGIAYAHEGEDHSPAAAGAKQSLPGTIAGIWQAIDQKTAELKQLIQSGSLTNVHHVAYAVRDLVAALPARSTDLPTDKQAAIKADVKFIATLAERLDASGDANDKAGAQGNYDKLAKVLTHLRANSTK